MTSAAGLIMGSGIFRPEPPHPLREWEGVPELQHVIATLAASGFDPVVVVLGERWEEVLTAVDFGAAMAVVNEEWRQGLGSFVRAGLGTLVRESACEAALIALGDQPRLDSALLARLAAESSPTAQVVIPRYRHAFGYPLMVRRELWDRLLALSGGADPLALVRAHPTWVTEVHSDRLPDGPIGSSFQASPTS